MSGIVTGSINVGSCAIKTDPTRESTAPRTSPFVILGKDLLKPFEPCVPMKVIFINFEQEAETMRPYRILCIQLGLTADLSSETERRYINIYNLSSLIKSAESRVFIFD